MRIEDFIIKLEELFDKKDKFKHDSVFFDIVEWSSFNQLLLTNFINEEYKVDIKINDLKPFNTIEDLFKVIIKSSEIQ